MSSYLKHFPVGTPVPDSVHAVCCSLPTMEDVIGYEEKSPEVMDAVRFAYPRFVLHEYIVRATSHIGDKLKLSGNAVYALTSLRAARELVNYIDNEECSITNEGDFAVVFFPTDEDMCSKAKAFLQHTGTGISSRHAEDYLIEEGLLEMRFEEKTIETEPEHFVVNGLRQYIASDFVRLSTGGMNAFYAAFKATRAIQRPKGKTVYLQLGWLYLDTQRILEKFLSSDEKVITLLDVFDKKQIESVFAEYGDRIAAVVTELPTNPLIQTLDIDFLDRLISEFEIVRIFDPTMASICNVDVLPHTDILVTSLTKYAGNCGDVMMGALALNPKSRFYGELAGFLPKEIDMPYPRDVERMAYEIQSMPEVIADVNRNVMHLIKYFETHEAVQRVYWAYEPESASCYEKLAIGVEKPGAMITIVLKESIKDFYDHACVVKGPSFGTFFTMMCPFMYLAHYDLVSQAEGRESLKELGLDPHLLRISVGCEPVEEIIAAFEEGFAATTVD